MIIATFDEHVYQILPLLRGSKWTTTSQNEVHFGQPAV
jgi:hypothetical protein